MKESQIWGALFDLDGVLIDSPEVHVRAWVQVFRPYDVVLPPARLHREEGRKSLDIARGIVSEYKLDLDDETLKKLIETKRRIYRENAPRGMRKDARYAFQILKKSGWILGLVSGSVRKNVETALSSRELDLFDVIITAESYTSSKPNPEPYLTACNESGLTPARCVAIENAPLGISSARTAGMKVVALTSTLPESDLQEADDVIDDLSELPRLLKLYKKGN